MSKKKHHNNKNRTSNTQVDNNTKNISDTELDEILNDDEERTEKSVDIGELQHLIDEIEDIKPYEERRVRRNRMPEKEKKSLNIDKKVIILITSLVLAVALFVTLIVDACCSSSGNKEDYVTSAKLKEVTNEKVITLMNDYIKAVEACDMESLEKLVDNIDYISADKLAKESEYIESYENIKLNYVKGMNDGDLVILMSYDNKILNIDTLAPGAMMVYVTKEDDNYLVHTGVQNDEEVLKYLEELAKNENIIEYNEEINKSFEEACKSDKNLAEFKAAITSTEEKTTNNEETTEPVEETTKKK